MLKALGIGLTADEIYRHAFEKGVLLGPNKYTNAVELFHRCKSKAMKEGKTALAQRAEANSDLYTFLSTGKFTALSRLYYSLEGVPEIEQVGSCSEMMPVDDLRLEICIRTKERELLEEINEKNHDASAKTFEEIAELFKTQISLPLTTYTWIPEGKHRTARTRFLFYQGKAAWHRGMAFLSTDPESASQWMSRSLKSFRQCKDEEHARDVETRLQNIRLKRTCWVCQREAQGAGSHFNFYNADIAPYFTAVIEKMGQDISTLSLSDGRLTVCRPCSSMIENIASSYAAMYAEKVRQELQSHVKRLETQIKRLKDQSKSGR